MTVTGKLSRFGKNTSGNVAMMFALSLTSLMGASGAAVDYSRYSNARSAISAASDAAALAGALSRGDATARQAAAKTVFEANLRAANFVGTVDADYKNIQTKGVNTGYRVEAKGKVRSMFGALTGSSELEVVTAAQAQSATDDPVEIAFVLDTTDSMEGDRIDTLKSATNGVLDEFTKRSLKAGMFKFGVVPFGQYVNVGLPNRSKPWLDVPADYQTPITTHCHNVFDKIGDTNCRIVNYPFQPAVPASKCKKDGRDRPCGGSPAVPAYSANVCDPIYSTTPRNVCGPHGGDWVRWNGCVGSRNFPLNTQDGGYGTRIPGIMGVTCGTPLLDLTTNVSTVRSTINGLTTSGETYIPSGLIWGWRMLSKGEPLDASCATCGTRKFMVLVTDGRNTKAPNYPNHDLDDGMLADSLTKTTCQNIATDKVNNVRIYTIAFEMDGLDGKKILQDCAASTGGQFFDATDAVKLREAFGQIVDAVMSVKLTH
ncbi:MAG: pilus assembly protein TadG-related protein [Beijerinckiaceae bacterium]